MGNDEEYIYYDEAGREVHVFKDEFGNDIHVIQYRAIDNIFTGHQWCPECLKELTHYEGYWKCDICGFNISDEEVEETNGIPSLAAALDYRDEYGL